MLSTKPLRPCKSVSAGLPLPLLLFLLLAAPASAQTFTRINSGDIISDLRGSRGSAWGDYDDDGDVDLFLTDVDTVNFLYRNNGNGTFSKMTVAQVGSIAGDAGISNAASWGDMDNDGDPDLFVATRDVPRLFYRNNGNGTFTRITSGAIVNDITDARGCSWVDYDLDGYLDLFVANKAESNQLYRNNGDATFSKITSGALVTDNGNTSGGIWGDYDNDGDPDLYVANDGDGSNEKNFLYRNNGDGTFTAVTGGPAVNNGGDSESAAWGDYDNDGDLDLFVANDGPDGDQVNFLYTNNGGNFSRADLPNITDDPGDTEDCTWADYDNDGDLDMLVVNNNSQNNILYRNDNASGFTAVTGINIYSDLGESEGCSWADYDNDGDMDLFVANDTQVNFLYRNDGNSNRWIRIKLVGTVSNRTAIGARIHVYTSPGGSGQRQMRETSGQTSAKSQNDLIAHFGLGSALTIDSIVVNWPSGLQSRLTGVNSNQLLQIVEGTVTPPPAVPQNLTANALSTTQIQLGWQANGDAPRSYYIYRSLSAGTGYTLIDSVSHPVSSYTNNGLGISTSYYYRITALNVAGESGFSNEASATTNGIPPSTPTNLSAVAASESVINLNWNASLNAPLRYHIFRSFTAGTGFVLIDSVNHPVTGFSNGGLAPQTTAYYRIRASNSWGNSAQTGEVFATTNGLPPTPPLSAAAVAVSAGQIDLSWLAPAAGTPQRYRIFRSGTSGSGFVQIDSVAHPATGYSDAGLNSLTTYFYVIRAVNTWGVSEPSNQTTATTFGLPPGTPAGLVLTRVTSDTIAFSWNAASGAPLRYRIYRSLTAAGSYALYDSVAHPILAYTDTTIVPLSSYYYRLSAANEWGGSAVGDSIFATPPPPGVPGPPGALQAQAQSGSSIALGWQLSNNLPTRYRIYRSLTQLENYEQIDSVDHPQNSYTDTGLAASTSYFYQIRAVNTIGESGPSNISFATTFGAPLPVTGLAVTAFGSDSISLAWQASADGNPQRYRILRSLTAGSGFAATDSVDHPQTSYTSGNLTPQTTYYFRIEASNTFGAAGPSNEVNATTDGIAPGVPLNLTVAASSATQGELSWSVAGGAPERYYIYRARTSGQNYVKIDSVDHPQISYSNSGLLPETLYFYVVTAGNIWGESLFSNEDSLQTPGLVPQAPALLIAQGISEERIDLQWQSSSTALDYRIYRSLTSGGGFSLIDSVNAPDTLYNNSGLPASTTFYYQITARNVWGESIPSNEAAAATGELGVPGVPTALSATPVSTTELRLAWQISQSGDPVRYRIYRSLTAGSGFVRIDSLNHPQSIYIDSGLDSSTSYYYRVSAVNPAGESPSSNQATATTFGAPTVPAELSATPFSSSRIDLEWQVSSGEPTRYRIYRSLVAGGNGELLDSLDHPAVSYSDSNLTSLSTYYYRISADNQWGSSTRSAEVSASTPGVGTPSAPANLTAGTVSNTSIVLSWSVSSGTPQRYRVYRSLASGSGFVLQDSLPHPVNSYLDRNLAPATTYYYRISATNELGESPFSNESSGSTFGPPSQPANPAAQTLSESAIALGWSPSSRNPQRYRIYRSLESGSNFVRIDSVNHPATGFNDGGLLAETEYFYRIDAVNQWGISQLSDEVRSTTNNSAIIAPAIIAASLQISPLIPQAGEAIDITIRVSGSSPAVTLRYGRVNDLVTGFSLPMIASADNFSAQIPAGIAGSEGLWINLTAENGAGSDSYPGGGAVLDINVQIADFATIQSSGAFPTGLPANGWNTVALPFATGESISLPALLGPQQFNQRGEPVNWSAYDFSSGSLQPTSDIRAGKAYFLYHKSGEVLTLAVNSASSNDIAAFANENLRPGWNLLPWPYSFADTLRIRDSNRIGSVWTQSNNIWSRLTDQLQPDNPLEMVRPYQALAIYNKTNTIIRVGEVLVSGNEAAKRSRQAQRDALIWRMELILDTANGRDAHNTLGIAAQALEGNDSYDEAEPPLAGPAAALYFAGEPALSSDIRPSGNHGATWELLCDIPHQPGILFWKNSGKLPADWQLRLFDISENKQYALNGPEAIDSLSLRHNGRHRFYLLAGTPEYVLQSANGIRAALPQQFDLLQNYPNPFNATTRIRFDLPHSADISLVVYNILGQEVARLVDNRYETGRHRVSWNGRDRQGRDVASGLYFFRLQAGSWSKVIKAMLVK